MNGNLSLSELFLSANGRSPRMPSVVAAAVLLTVAAIYETFVESLTARVLTGVFVYPALAYLGACVLSKRLHDRGRSGWWAALILVSIAACWPHPIGFFDFPFAVVLVWAAIDLALLPGEPGANRYGANPLRPLAPA